MKIEARLPHPLTVPKPRGSSPAFSALLRSSNSPSLADDSQAVGFQTRGMFGRMEAIQNPVMADLPKSEIGASPLPAPVTGFEAATQNPTFASPLRTAQLPATEPALGISTRIDLDLPLTLAADRTANGGPVDGGGEGLKTSDAIDVTVHQTGTSPARPGRETSRLHSPMTVTTTGSQDAVAITLSMAGLTLEDQAVFRRRALAVTKDYGLTLDKLKFTSEGRSQADVKPKGTTSWR